MFKRLLAPFHSAFRRYYETRINVPFGIARFIGNVAFIQMGRDEYVTLPPTSPGTGAITLTAPDMRPKLRYTYWPKGMEWRENMPEVEVIVELRGFQVRGVSEEYSDVHCPDACKWTNWDLVDITDPRVAPLKNLFLAFAFYLPLSDLNKRKMEVASGTSN